MNQRKNIPNGPVLLGKTLNGEPIWMEPQDLVPTPDEELERVHNTISARESTLIRQIAELVIENAVRFTEQTFLTTAGKHAINLYHNDQKKALAWAVRAGYESIQDGLTTIVKIKGKIVRTMTAEVEPRYSDAVAKKVMELI